MRPRIEHALGLGGSQSGEEYRRNRTDNGSTRCVICGFPILRPVIRLFCQRWRRIHAGRFNRTAGKLIGGRPWSVTDVLGMYARICRRFRNRRASLEIDRLTV